MKDCQPAFKDPSPDRIAGLNIERTSRRGGSRKFQRVIWIATVVVGCGSVSAATWNIDNSGNWGTASNWSGTVPDAAGATALLTFDIASNRTVTINISSRTVGVLTVGDYDYTTSGSVWNSYTLAASAGLSLILDNGASNSQINKTSRRYSTGTAAGDTISAPILLNGSLDIRNSGDGSLNFTTGGVTANSAGSKTITNMGTGAGKVVMSGVIGDGGGTVAVIQNSANSGLTLSGANTYSGNTRISAGMLTIGNNLALQNSVFDSSGTGTLAFSPGINTPTFGGLTNGANLTLAANVTALTLNPGAGVITTYSGNLGSATAGMTLTKQGAGTQILAGANTYNGNTLIESGRLLVNNTTGSGTGGGTVTVNSGATLGGSGTVSGAVNVTGSLAPGAAVGTLATGTLTMNSGSTFDFEVDSSADLGVAADLQKVAGGLNLIGSVALTLNDLASGKVAFAPGTMFSLLNYTGAWNQGHFTYNSAALEDGGQFQAGLNLWQIDYNAATGGSNFNSQYAGGPDSFVNITAIPEPRAALLGGLGVLILLRRRRCHF
jgi:autotransporter-associated beta strand protein